MDSAGQIVKSLFECMQERNWDGASRLLSPSAHIEFTETGEAFDGDNFLAMNRAYPEGWAIEVVEVLAVDDRVAVQVRVTQGESVFWCAGFYTVTDGLITRGVEHWVTERSQPVPQWRKKFGTQGRSSE